MTINRPCLRYWVYRRDVRPPQWRVLSQTNDEQVARWLYRNARELVSEGGLWLVDSETATVLEEYGA